MEQLQESDAQIYQRAYAEGEQSEIDWRYGVKIPSTRTAPKEAQELARQWRKDLAAAKQLRASPRQMAAYAAGWLAGSRGEPQLDAAGLAALLDASP